MFTKAQVEAYFIAEKQESLLFVIVGIIAILVAVSLVLWLKTPFSKGLALPLIAIGLLQCIAGYTVYARSDAQRKDMVYKMDLNPDAIKTNEIPRMEKVMHNFMILRWVEMLLLAAGLVLVVVYRQQQAQQFWFGLGVALTLQATVMLTGDFVAEKRGAVYLNGLQGLVK